MNQIRPAVPLPIRHLTAAIQWACLALLALLTLPGCKPERITETNQTKPSNKVNSLIPAPQPTTPKHDPPDVRPASTAPPTQAQSTQTPPAQTQSAKTQSAKKRDPSQYSAARLNKNNNLLVLAFQPDIRASFVISNSRTLLDEKQMTQAKKLALSFDERFVEIRRRRAAVLESATDDQDVEAQLMELRMDVADLIGVIRVRVSQDILTEEQRKQSRKNYEIEMERLKSLEKSLKKSKSNDAN